MSEMNSVSGFYDSLIEQIKSIDTTDLSDKVSRKPVTKVIEEQKVYFWIRLYLKEEISDITEGDDFEISYNDERLNIKFICFGKKNSVRDHEGELTNYDSENDNKILCLMVDENEINTNDSIPFIRTLFKTSRFYEYQLIRRDDLKFKNTRTEEIMDYIDCDF